MAARILSAEHSTFPLNPHWRFASGGSKVHLFLPLFASPQFSPRVQGFTVEATGRKEILGVCLSLLVLTAASQLGLEKSVQQSGMRARHGCYGDQEPAT